MKRRSRRRASPRPKGFRDRRAWLCLARAEREAERVFSEAGLDIQWLNCPMRGGAAVSENPCAKPLDENALVVQVLAEPARNGFQDDVFGAAVFPVLASVYYEPARRTFVFLSERRNRKAKPGCDCQTSRT
jgi:hypothetical protein